MWCIIQTYTHKYLLKIPKEAEGADVKIIFQNDDFSRFFNVHKYLPNMREANPRVGCAILLDLMNRTDFSVGQERCLYIHLPAASPAV